MPDFPPLANPDVSRWVGERSYAAALGYARDHAIASARYTGLTLKAQCQGSRPAPYRVSVTLNEDGIAAGQCSCPIGAGGHCKHVGALLLTWIATPEDFIEVEALDVALNRLSQEQVVELVLRLARRSPEVEMLLELSLPVRREGQEAGDELVDTSAMRRELAHALRQIERGMASTEEVRAHTQRVLDAAGAAVDGGETARAVSIYQSVIEAVTAFQDALGNGDESEGDDYYENYHSRYDDDYDVELDPALFEMLGESIDQCVEGLRRCLEATRDEARRETILDTLFEVYRWGMGGGEEATMGNDVPSVILEQATTAERQYVAELARQAMPARSDYPYDDWGAHRERQQLAHFWLTLERDTLDDEGYLQFCRDSGLTSELVERLLVLGQMDEATEETRATGDLLLLGLEKVFAGRGQRDAFAEVVRERARTSSHNEPFVSWLKQYAQEAGRQEEALGYAKELFWQHPAGQGYEELRELERPLGQWEALRAETLARLERGKLDAVLIQIYLLEHDVARAIEAVDRIKVQVWGTYGASDPRVVVAKAAELEWPDDAIRLYVNAANDLIALQGRANYAVVAEHLMRVRQVYRQQGRGAEWQAFIGELRARHKRLPALQDELKKAGLFEWEREPPQPQRRTDDGNPAQPAPGTTVRLLRADEMT